MSVIIGVDGSGRTHRLDRIEAATPDRPVIRVGAPAGDVEALRDRLAAAPPSALVLVDDAHRLELAALDLLAAAARAGQALVIARRPTVTGSALAALDEAVAATGPVEVLAPLDGPRTRELVAAVTGRPCSPDTAASVLAGSGGLPVIAVALASALGPGPVSGPVSGSPPALLARLQRRLAVLAPEPARLARLLALRLDLTDAARAGAAGLDLPATDAAIGLLRDEGLLVPGTEEMIPAVAEALLAELAMGHRRRIHNDVALALVATGAPPVAAAGQLRAARARGTEAAAVYLAAGEHVRFSDPAAALGWFDDAQDAGASAAEVAAGRAEAAALLGLAVDEHGDLDRSGGEGVPATAAARLALVAGALAAHQGRADRAGPALLAAGPPGPALAVPTLVSVGRREQAEPAAGTPAPSAVRLLAAAALAGTDPAEGLPLAIEAAEAFERTPPAAVLPDTPHALGAVLAVAGGDVATAVDLLERARRRGIGGPVAADRHELLLAWATMRAGRLEPAREQVRRLTGADLNGRDRMLFAAVNAGLARRSGDIATLREAWPTVERVLARRSLDLFQLEAAEELAVAAARLRRSPRMVPTMAGFEAIVRALGSPPAWVVTLGWVDLQVAVAGDDPAAASVAAERICAAPAIGGRQLAQQGAARQWALALAGDVDPEAVIAAADELAAVELPWEASRLAGDAAIRVPAAAAARRLLERARDLARDLAPPEPSAARPPGSPDPAQPAGLSEREIEVATLVLDGRTHREIGAQLYIAPKTVEHHVARIRAKLGATTRAEFVAALRALLDSGSVPP